MASGIPVGAATGERCPDDGARTPHLVLFERGTTGEFADRAIDSACGSLLAYYPEIAVAVASAPAGEFAARLDSARAYSAGTGGPTPAATSGDATVAAAGRPPAGAGDEASWNMRAIGARDTRAQAAGDGAAVAVLDSGIDRDHPELSGSFSAGMSTSCLSGAATSSVPASAASDSASGSGTAAAHGTHVAGIIAGAPDGSGVTGVAPGTRIASVRVIGDDGATTPRAVICGLMWAARHDIAVANASFMLTSAGSDCVPAGAHPVAREAISRAVEYATSHGTVVVAAATNQARKLTPAPTADPSAVPRPASPDAAAPGVCRALPASLPGVVTVSALTADGVKAPYSSYGLGVIDVTAPGGAPGQCVRSTVPGGYARMCGTSMAAAHTSGVLALLAAAHPAFSAHQLIDLLHSQADAKPCPASYDHDDNGTQDAYCTGYAGYNGFYGHGVVDAAAAGGAGTAASR